MDNYYHQNSLIISVSFCIAIILQIMPCPFQLDLFQPSWINLFLIYWIITLPSVLNLKISFILGLFTDFILNSILGLYAFAFSILNYILVSKFRFFYKMYLWQQTIIVIFISLFIKLIIFFVEYLIINISFQSKILWSSIVDGILWPWLFLFMRKITK